MYNPVYKSRASDFIAGCRTYNSLARQVRNMRDIAVRPMRIYQLEWYKSKWAVEDVTANFN